MNAETTTTMNGKKYIASMTGYKATRADMTCQGYKFELGKWHEVDGEIEMCKRGFHFTVQPSGPWSYYSETGTRIFKIEAEQVLDTPVEPGADFKLVCKRIRLVEEITPGGYSNTGDRNTGYRNTGDSNTGYSNTGNSNAGNSNTGHSNTGDSNTGYSNTGDRNTGNRNTGNRNTGDSNTGYSNTGNGNATNYSAGFFCVKEPKVISFDVQTRLTHDQFLEKYPEADDLAIALHSRDSIDFDSYKRIPGITKAKLKALHKKHLAAKP